MDILEQNLDELFDLNPFLAEIYSNYSADDQQKMSCLETISPAVSSSSISSVAAVDQAPPQLISFENGRLMMISSTTNNINADIICNTSCSTSLITSSSQIISFSPPANSDDFGKKLAAAPTPTRTPLQAQDHVMAERKRRENLSQLFIALSKLVPGLKKLDKASLLEDAINYLKALQERVSALEKEEITITTTAAAAVEGNTRSFSCELAPPAEISVRISDKHVLIKICCKKQMGLMSRIPCELERIHLSVIDMRIMPFGGAALDHVTILAEMQSEFIGTMKEIVEHLQAVLGQTTLQISN